MRLPAQAARQLPDQSTTLRVDSSSTDDSRLRGALPTTDLSRCSKRANARLLYHLVGTHQKGFGDGKADDLGGLEIDDKLDRCR